MSSDNIFFFSFSFGVRWKVFTPYAPLPSWIATSMAWSRILRSISRSFSVMGCSHPAEDEMRRRAKYYRLDMGGETHKGSKKKRKHFTHVDKFLGIREGEFIANGSHDCLFACIRIYVIARRKKKSMLLIPRNVGAAISDEEVALGVEGTFIYLWEVSRMTTIRLELSCRRRQRWTTWWSQEELISCCA